MVSTSAAVWRPVGAGSALEVGPGAIPAVPSRGRSLESLPFEALSWPDFESLQWRVLRDVEGLRHAQIYGDPGQTQLGLDIIAMAADGSGVALQSKRVKNFGPARITAAVDAFRNTARPFSVSRFIIGVSREVRTTQSLDKFKEHQKELEPVELELWDRRELSQKLKGAPGIVIEYFGIEIAETFCDPFVINAHVVPSRDVVAVREAIARTPEVTTGAGEMIAEANTRADGDPAGALALVDEAQKSLNEAGFTGHAAQHESLRASLLVAVGRGTEATRRRLDQLWLALDQGHSVSADMASHEIASLAAQVSGKEAREHRSVAEIAVRLYANPLAATPNLVDLMVGDTVDRARLAALAGETALATGDNLWLKKNAVRTRNLADRLPATDENRTLATRLRILAAEGSGEWAQVLGDARALRLGHALSALVQARYARYLALNQKFGEADASWDEAAGNACLAEQWTDAARWVLCRRAFRARWRPFTSDELLPVQTALSARGPDSTILTRDEDALEYAYGRLADDKLRAAAIAAQRALRDAVTLSDWEGERRARRLLSDVLRASGEYQAAAHLLVLAGEVSVLKRFGSEQSSRFLDVTVHLEAKSWWIAGAAYALLATQADLVPDDLVSSVVDHALAELDAAEKGTLVDLPSFAGSRYLGAVAALAGLSERLNPGQADTALTYFEAQPPVEQGHYRFHDENEAKFVAGLLATHPDLTERGLRHLVHLLGRSESSRKPKMVEAVTDRIDDFRELIQQAADQGNYWAGELLEVEHPEELSPLRIDEARARLERQLVHTRGVYGSGSGSASVSDAVLVRTLPVGQQQAAVDQLVDRATSPEVSGLDRASYLLAASNLRFPTDRTRRSDLLERALALVISPPDSVADAMDEAFRHPLGAVRMNIRRDSRGEAAHLAAALARTKRDKERVRSAALGLIGDDAVSEYWVTRALQRLGDTMAPDVGFLSGQNWALKSFAAILWSRTTEPEPVGFRLAADPDVRVRRALAHHLAISQAEEDASAAADDPSRATASTRRASVRAAVLEVLRDDPCFSVRFGASDNTATPHTG